MLTQKRIERFSALIQDRYGLEGLADYLDLGIEMLFYIKKDTFRRREIQNVASALRDINVILRCKE